MFYHPLCHYFWQLFCVTASATLWTSNRTDGLKIHVVIPHLTVISSSSCQLFLYVPVAVWNNIFLFLKCSTELKKRSNKADEVRAKFLSASNMRDTQAESQSQHPLRQPSLTNSVKSAWPRPPCLPQESSNESQHDQPTAQTPRHTLNLFPPCTQIHTNTHTHTHHSHCHSGSCTAATMSKLSRPKLKRLLSCENDSARILFCFKH